MDKIVETSSIETNQLASFDRLNKDDQIAFVRKSILNLSQPDYRGGRPFIAELTDHILDSPNRKSLIEESFNCVYDNKKDFHYSKAIGSGYHSIRSSDVDDWVDYITLRAPYDSIEAAISGDDFDTVLEKIGMIVDKNSLPWVTEHLIRVMVDKEEDLNSKDKLIKVGKVLIGLSPDDPRDFRTSLNELYKNISFENYQTNLEASAEDIKMIRQVVKSTDEVLVDMGCGTGRLANKIAKELPGIKIVGVDPSSENLEKAKMGDTTKSVRYEVGSMGSNTLSNNSVDVIFILGRTLPHLRDYRDIVEAFKDFNRILKTDGRVLFDAPDPNTGVYLENRKKYLDILKSLKIPLQDTSLLLRHFYRVVDSPDGKNLYDRYIPDWNGDDFTQIGTGAGRGFKGSVGTETGFNIAELERVVVPGWDKSESIYFVATKKEDIRYQTK